MGRRRKVGRAPEMELRRLGSRSMEPQQNNFPIVPIIYIYCNNVVIMIYQYIDYIEWEAVNEAGPHNTFFQLCHLYATYVHDYNMMII